MFYSKRLSSAKFVGALVLLSMSALASGLEPEPAKRAGGLVLWLRADDIDGDGSIDSPQERPISRWTDSSGRGNHLEQKATNRQPTLHANVINGRPAVRFGGDDFLQLDFTKGLAAGDQPFHAIFVMKAVISSQSPNPRLLDLGGAAIDTKKARRGFWVGYQGNGHNRLGISHGSEGESRRVAWNSQPNILEVTYAGRGKWSLHFNGASDGRGVFRSRPFLGFQEPVQLAIGQHWGVTASNTFYRGDLAEVLIYNRALLAEEQNAVGMYLSKKYRIKTPYGPLPRFEKDVLPILLQHCHKCHGSKKREGELDLRTVSSMLQGGTSGTVLVRGHSERSYFLQMIASGEMPPEEEKRLTNEEISLLRRWVNLGAPADEKIVQPSPRRLYTDEHRKHWAFQKPTKVQPPIVREQNRLRTPIDAFVLRRLESEGLSFAPQATRAMLARRAWFDLTGLPPTPAELQSFLNDPSPDAFAKVVDQLLDSPAYGQRWARHWLDIARYADYYDADAKARQMTAEPLDAWRYRDWVVKSFNNDLPFDQLIIHQIAGDLLPNPKGGAVYPDGLIATTFLSNGVWDPHDADKEKIVSDMADDNIDTIGKAFLGLTLGCARCHDHKFDPISTADYYALAGMFYSSHFIANLGTKGGAYTMSRVPLVSEDVVVQRQEHVTRLNQVKAQLAALDKQSPTAPANDPRRLKLTMLRDQLQREMPPEIPRAIAVQEGGTPGGLFPDVQDVPIHIRGSYTRLGRVVPRGLPKFFHGESQPPISNGSGRLELARWVASPDNPLTVRVIVNRVWQWHFGEGLVRSPNNFGLRAQPPSHPLLLDWLAQQFIADGWSLKKLHRRVMLSTTYQQTSVVEQQLVERDPENRLLARFAPRRLEAEAIRDAMLYLSGQLDPTMDGPAGNDLNIRRRSLYVQTARWNRSNFATLFDAANPDASTAQRVVSTVTPQSLFLLNNSFPLTQARYLATRILSDSEANDDAARIEGLYQRLYGRSVTDKERVIAKAILESKRKAGKVEAWTDLAHVLLCTNEFVYLD